MVIALAMVLALATSAWAQVGGVGYLMKEKARGFRTNAATRGEEQPTTVKPAAPKPAPVQPVVAPPAAPKLTDAQITAAKKLQGDLDAIKPKTAATADQTQALMKDLLNSAQGGNQPGMNALMKLASDLSAGWPAQKMDAREKEQFCRNLVLLLNCSGTPASETQKTMQNSEVLLKYSGMPNLDAQKILASLKTIVTQLQK
jgi:hypothetical protein